MAGLNLLRARRWLPVVRKLAPEVLPWSDSDFLGEAGACRRAVLGALRDSLWLRIRFPKALSEGAAGRYARWLRCGRMRSREDCSSEVLWQTLFDPEDAESILDHYLHDSVLRRKQPDGILREGRAAMADWLLKQGREKYGWPASQILWFLQWCDEQDVLLRDLSRRVSPAAQRRFTAPGRDHRGQRGVNVIGHFTFASGLQRSATLTIQALHHAGERVWRRNLPILSDRDLSLRSRDYLDYEEGDVTVLHATPDPHYQNWADRAALHPRAGVRRVAHMAWELPEIPRDWPVDLPGIQEIWTYSRFVASAMRRYQLPVCVIPPGIPQPVFPMPPRARFGLPDDRRIFLFIFDLCSDMERKNPEGVITAFQRAARSDDRALLVIKVSHPAHDPRGLASLSEKAAQTGALILREHLSTGDTLGLIHACDAYISLHRAEGFGFTLAEAMILGKPVIATAWSGNVDYMNASNSYPVRFSPGQVPEGCPAYPAGLPWAEPDLDHAAHLIRRIMDVPEEARAIARAGESDARRLFSVEASAAAIASRLKVIRDGQPPEAESQRRQLSK